MIRTSALIAICTASALGGFVWYGFHIKQPDIPMDHISKLSKEDYKNGNLRAKDVINRRSPRLSEALEAKGLKLGSPVFIRIFKESRELEVWVQSEKDKKFHHFRTWDIAAMSGQLGPKLKEGDRQAPEGFYFVPPSRMKPDSSYHLAFNIGYPNSYDRAHNRTGSFIMIHGNQVSIGCFAMTDYWIEEIYTLCAKALENGQPYFRVHSFPFRMTDENLSNHSGSKWFGFWQNLKEGYDWFEENRTTPDVSFKGNLYIFGK